MKLITYIARIIMITLFSAILVICAKTLLFPKIQKVSKPINTEHYVVQIKSSIIKKALKSVGEVSNTSSGISLTIPSSSKDLIALDILSSSSEMYGVNINNEAEYYILSLSEGPGSTILVPVPMLIALIDRNILEIKEEE